MRVQLFPLSKIHVIVPIKLLFMYDLDGVESQLKTDNTIIKLLQTSTEL